LARWLCTQLQLFILDEPTRGIDVGTKDEIRRKIAKLSSTGLAVLLISSDLEELVESCDRVFVLRDGTTVTELNGEEVTERAIMEAMAKQQSRHESKAARD
jgi:ribose transport system ATP-binding protein